MELINFVLNVLWLVLSGIWMAIGYVIAGVIMFVLIITIPFSIASFRFAGYALWPFGRTVVERPDADTPSLIGNVIWFILAGWWIALGHIILSLPNPNGGLPIGVTLRELATPDDIEDTHDNCPGLHGEATNHHGVAFGCSCGVLLLEAHGDHFDAAKLEYPAEFPDEVRVGTLRSAHELEIFVGNWEGGLVIVDPDTAPYFTPVPVTGTVLHFAIDEHGEVLVVLTADGSLHRLNPLTGASLGAPLSVMDSFTVMPGHGQVRPTFVLGAEAVFVIDPRQTDVLEVHVDEWEIERRLAVGGSPGSIAIFSVSPDFGHADDHTH